MAARRAGAALLVALTFTSCPGEDATEVRHAPAVAAPAVPEQAPTVLLVTWDTTRADHLGAYGARGGATPRLDGLAQRGLVFEQAWAAAPITLPSHTTILTGLDPLAHGVHDNGLYTVSHETVLLAEALSAHGFRSAAFVGAFVLDARYGLGQGFERYGMPPTRRLGQALAGADRPANQVVDDALAWLGQVPAEQPVFLWTHFFDPHFAYVPPEPFRSRFADDPYTGEIAFCDEQLGRLLDALSAAGRDARLLVVMAADHGEALGEHGEATHGVFLYEAVTHVPLIVAGTGVAPGRVAEPVGLTDIAPTVLEWAGVPRDAMPDARAPSLLAHKTRGGTGPGAAARGASAVAVAEGAGGAGDQRAILLENLLPYHAHGWHPQSGLVWRGFKLIDARHAELYELATDPGEAHDLSGERPELLAAMRDRMAAARAAATGPAQAAPRVLSVEERDRLTELGYAGGPVHDPWTAGTDLAGDDLPDASERLGLLRRRDEALFELWKGRRLLGWDGMDVDPRPAAAADARHESEGRAHVERARELLGGLRAESPGDPEFAELSGLAAVTLGLYEEAMPLFEQQALHNRRSAQAHFSLGVCYEHIGLPDDARAEMLKALTLEPHALVATTWMADRHVERQEWGHAAWWLDQLLTRAGPSIGSVEDDEAVARLAERLGDLREKARSAGQPIEPPPDWSATDFTPERLRSLPPAAPHEPPSDP